MLTAVGPAQAEPTSTTVATAAGVAEVNAKMKPKKPRKNKPTKFTPKAGVKFNDPYNRKHKSDNVRNQIVKTINAVPGGQTIMFASWNTRGAAYRDALIRAHQRGVTVKVIVDVYNANKQRPNPDVDALRAEFKKKKNKKRARDQRSLVKRCVGSCRGGRGIPHQKFFLFSQAGNAQWVTMYGSNNATDIAVVAQWNDHYTIVGDQQVYNGFSTIFDQMMRDKRMKNPYATFSDTAGTSNFFFYPYYGAGAGGDPDLKRLKQVTCSGATGGTGTNGRTRIRMGQDALLGERGIKIAHKLVKLRKAGCDIKIVYSLLGKRIRNILKAGRVPTLQYSYDRDRDGLYDIYLHMKAMTISGNYAGRTDARVVYNGTANWTPKALMSDEVVAEIWDPALEAKYTRWINYLFNHRPKSWGPVNLGPCRAACSGGGIDRTMVGADGTVKEYDPYALMREEGL